MQCAPSTSYGCCAGPVRGVGNATRHRMVHTAVRGAKAPGKVVLKPDRAERLSFFQRRAVEEDKEVSSGAFEETTEAFPDPPQQDFWEGDKFEWLGNTIYFAVAGIVLVGVGVGVFAAQTYNTGATVFLKTATSEENPMRLLTPQAPPVDQSE